MSDIYDNAVDSLRIGMEFFLKETGYSSRKHAILTVFHAIELLLKECLAQTNPILIYKNIDAKITDDAQTVGVREASRALRTSASPSPPRRRKPSKTSSGFGTALSITDMTTTNWKMMPLSPHP
jgi:hypothetical protein